jgi:hypothetical protein
MPELSRRDFLAAALAMGATVAVSPRLEAAIRHVTASGSTDLYFLTPARARTCAAICARIVPSETGSPGATEAHAVTFIDRFLAAFELPSVVADGPAIYIHGRFSDRNDHRGDDFLSAGRAHFLPLSRHQELSWRAELYGVSALDHPPAGTYVSTKWRAQVGSLLPAPSSIRKTYADGLDAFDSFSQKTFGTPFASAQTFEQDILLEAAGNVIVSAFPLPAPPFAPDAAKALFPLIVLHTFQGTYGLPEYRWQRNDAGVWESVAWDGDTQPLGNSIYDERLFAPGKGPNEGFGDPHVYVPRGGYRERRPVSTLGAGKAMSKKDIAPLVKALRVQAKAKGKGRATAGARATPKAAR